MKPCLCTKGACNTGFYIGSFVSGGWGVEIVASGNMLKLGDLGACSGKFLKFMTFETASDDF